MSPNQVRQVFENSGISIAEWARVKGFSAQLVYRVLSGKHRATRGQSHRIAVELGIKLGNIESVHKLHFQNATEHPASISD